MNEDRNEIFDKVLKITPKNLENHSNIFFH